jgi:hypothetical protein
VCNWCWLYKIPDSSCLWVLQSRGSKLVTPGHIQPRVVEKVKHFTQAF